MVQNMVNKSLLNKNFIDIVPGLTIRIPTVGEVLDKEDIYSNIVSLTTAVPYQYMVFLADMGIDFTTITDYDLFLMLFPVYQKEDLSILFGDLDLSDFYRTKNPQNDTWILYSPQNDLIIDELVYHLLSNAILAINQTEKIHRKMGNEKAKECAIEKARRKLERQARRRKKEESQFEKLVVAMVNRSDFKYDYDTVMDLSIYRFYRSVKQIQQNIAFENTMTGVYSGTIDTSKMTDKSSLSWIAK